MRILLTGASGQLGQALVASVPQQIELIATSRRELDLADAQACRSAVRAYQPHWVLNAGAYTAVDQAESEPELTEAVNAAAPRAFAEALAETGGRLLQVSTDYVFNGRQGHPYQLAQLREPLGVYGATKAAGEQAVETILGCNSDGRGTVLRTSWVYGPVGRNFLLSMLRLHQLKANAGKPLLVVADQVGCPTATFGLATACWGVIHHQLSGWHHWCDAGAASWYDFALAIGELAVCRGLIPEAAEVLPISTVDYPTSARRPAYSLLDCTETRQKLQLSPQHWRVALQEVIADVGA